MRGEDIEAVVVNYFSDLFSSTHPHGIEHVIATMQPKVSTTMNAEHMQPYTSKEVKQALFYM